MKFAKAAVLPSLSAIFGFAMASETTERESQELLALRFGQVDQKVFDRKA